MRFRLIIIIIISLVIAPSFSMAQISPRPDFNDFAIDIIWEAETYTPPGYRGKALATRSSMVNFVALVPSKNISSLEFSWFNRDSSASFSPLIKKEVGDNTLSFRTESFISNFSHNIELIVKDLRTGQVAKASTIIKLSTPEAHLYKEDSNRLFLGREDNFPGSVVQATLKPFYFNLHSIKDFSFSWFFDEQEYTSQDQANKVILNINKDTLVGTERSLRALVNNPRSSRESASLRTNIFIKQK